MLKIDALNKYSQVQEIENNLSDQKTMLNRTNLTKKSEINKRSNQKGRRAPSNVIFEIYELGSIRRIAAVDSGSGIEAVVQVPVSIGLDTAKQFALRKLFRSIY